MTQVVSDNFYFSKVEDGYEMWKRGFVSSTANVSEVTFANVMKVNRTPGRHLLIGAHASKIILTFIKIANCKVISDSTF